MASKTDDVLAELIDAAKNGETVSYRELAVRVGMNPKFPLALHSCLNKIVRESAERSKGLLPLLVESIETGMPGDGLFRELSDVNLYKGENKQEFRRRNVAWLHEFWSSQRA